MGYGQMFCLFCSSLMTFVSFLQVHAGRAKICQVRGFWQQRGVASANTKVYP